MPGRLTTGQLLFVIALAVVLTGILLLAPTPTAGQTQTIPTPTSTRTATPKACPPFGPKAEGKGPPECRPTPAPSPS